MSCKTPYTVRPTPAAPTSGASRIGQCFVSQSLTGASSLPAFTPQLRLETDACTSGDVKLLVKHYTRDGSGIFGPTSTVQVSVAHQWVPLSDAVTVDFDA